MKAFQELSSQGQMRRYHQMAHVALQAYPLKLHKLRCVSIRHNVIFRVDAVEGLFMLRIGYPDIRTHLMVESEMRWLDDMRQAGIDLNLSYPIANKTGNFVQTIQLDGIPSQRQVVLMTWLRGSLISDAPNLRKLFQLGASLAKLHNFAEQYFPTKPFMSFDKFQCAEWGGLAYLDDYHPLLSAEQKKLFRHTINLAETALASWRERDGLRLIHADLHLKNSSWYRGQIAVFDFDDCRWGHFLQDWGVILSWFRDDRDNSLRDAVINGYESQRILAYSEHDLKLALFHRVMTGLTFLVNFRPESRQAAIDEDFRWLERHL